MKDKMLKNKISVITGASRGIGREIALSYAREGASLMLICLQDEELLTEVHRETERLGAKSVSMSGDISEIEFCEKVYAETKRQLGSADILVNCAGTITRSLVEEMTLEEWHRVIDVNLHGAFYMCSMFLPGMRERNYGKVINITSQMAHIPHPSASPSYEVSKAGLTALTRHLALQYAKYNVCVNAIAPGSIDTDMPKSMTSEARQRLKNSVPLKRLGEPEELGECALFLASKMSNYVTGATLHVNGGSLML
jgi:3-oxoacyl-[acyl-carrier protein] reductase